VQTYVEEMRAAGADVEVTEYPEASHAYPPDAQTAMLQVRGQRASNCKVEEDAEELPKAPRPTGYVTVAAVPEA